ncbi:MAG TPA: acylphosphatase [Caldilineae bacterium]|nr:acylphosphatase [Caldilineae bacterium]
MQRLQAKIYGRVQGVGFRAFVLHRAQALNLTGTVRNVYFPSRCVDVVAEGPKTALQTLLDLLHEGPSMSRVDRVDVTWQAPTGSFSHFRIA